MNLRNRLNRLETVLAGKNAPHQRTFEQLMDDDSALWAWLEERGYRDHLAALEAGESGPEGLQDLLREQAAYDPSRRAWARIQQALDAGELPSEDDLSLIPPRPIPLVGPDDRRKR